MNEWTPGSVRTRERERKNAQREEGEKTQLNHDRIVVLEEQKKMDNHYLSSESWKLFNQWKENKNQHEH